MIRQKSFENEGAKLYLVPTPIGNLNEMTPRALEILNSVDVIACEDTRTSGQLLKHFSIHKRLIAYQNFNEESASKGILNLLEQGNSVALISDAGYPLISDPGQKVVTLVSHAGFPVVPVSGCSAVLNALVASGLVVQPFLFAGFLPSSGNECRKRLTYFKEYPETLIFYEAPHRISKTLQNILDVFGDREMCIAREITKLHEEFLRGTVSELLEVSDELKGEMVLVIAGNTESEEVSEEDAVTVLKNKIASGMSRRDAVKEAAKETGLGKNQMYDLLNSLDEEDV